MFLSVDSGPLRSIAMFEDESQFFGSACSATIAQFALRKNVKDHGKEFGLQVHDAINRCYVDKWSNGGANRR